MDEEARDVAAKLTVYQRAELAMEDMGQWAYDLGLVEDIEISVGRIMKWTPLGLRVASILREEEDRG